MLADIASLFTAVCTYPHHLLFYLYLLPVFAIKLPRARLKRHAPENSAEDVMLHSGLDVAQAAAFLHENMLHFFSDDHVDEAAAALDYLVDAGERECAEEADSCASMCTHPQLDGHQRAGEV